MVRELGEPDEYCDNPHWRTGLNPASLYRIEPVEGWIEANQGRVDKARASRVKRPAAAKAAHDQRRARRWRAAQEWLEGLPITVGTLPTGLLDDARQRFGFASHADP